MQAPQMGGNASMGGPMAQGMQGMPMQGMGGMQAMPGTMGVPPGMQMPQQMGAPMGGMLGGGMGGAGGMGAGGLAAGGMPMGGTMGAPPQMAMSHGGPDVPPQQQACLRYPDPLGLQNDMPPERAVEMLQRASALAQEKPFVWAYIDRPQDNSLFLVFFPRENSPPNDGLRYLEKETRFVVPAGPERQLEISESRYGFIPGGGEPSASRIRRRFRLVKGGNSQLVLIWYTRGQGAPIPPPLSTQPVRPYPLPPISQPPVWVAGERAGQRYFGPNPSAPGPAIPKQPNLPPGVVPPPGALPPNVMPGQMGDQAALFARQAMEHRRVAAAGIPQPGGPQGVGGSHAPPPGAHPTAIQGQQAMLPEEDDERGVSTRNVAAARYARNHEWMNEVFMYAAFGDKALATKSKPLKEFFNKDELAAQLEKLEKEVEELQAKSDARQQATAQARLHQRNPSDASMSVPPVGVTGT